MRRAPSFACFTLAAALGAGRAMAQSDYDEALAAAARHEQAGHSREAAASLEPAAARYPQDYALALRLGWLWFQAGDHAAARRRYAQALSLSADASHDARLGLGWSSLRLDARDDAARAFEQLLALDPNDASAREGLSLARASRARALRLWASLWLGVQAWAEHPTRTWSASATASVTAQALDWPVLGVTYRAVAYATTQQRTVQPPPPRPGLPPPPPFAQSSTSTNAQQEIHFMAGVARRTWAARAHVGYLWDAANPYAPATVFGVSGRLALRGDLSAELSDTVFADGAYVRAVAAWAADLGRGWSLGPVASLQLGGFTGGSFGALASFTRGGYAVSAGARYGDERRPTALAEALTFATDDRVRGALTLSGLVPLGGPFSLALRYDGLLLSTAQSGGSVDASAHFFTAAVAGAW